MTAGQFENFVGVDLTAAGFGWSQTADAAEIVAAWVVAAEN